MDPRSKKVCRYWLQGRCTRGRSCPFHHGTRTPPPSRVWSRNANAPSSSSSSSSSSSAAAASVAYRTKNTNSDGRRRPARTAAAGLLSTAGPKETAPDPSSFRINHLAKSNRPTNIIGATELPMGEEIDRANPTPQEAEAAAGATAEKRNYICDFFLKGMGCGYGDRCGYLHAWCTSPRGDLSFIAQLQGHQKVIRGIALPENSSKLFSASKDGNVRVWDCHSGQCIVDANLGDEVGCLVGEGPWVFAGIPNAVKAWNPQPQVEHTLKGPNGQVCSLVVGLDHLFGGVQDGRITVWKIGADDNSFHLAGSLTGHQSAVISLTVGRTRLYSGSMDTTIKVWDIATLQCLQALTDHSEVVTSLLCWDQFLLSCSLDETIKVWATAESGELEVVYTHKEEQGVLRLNGIHDMQGKPILLYSCNDNTVKLAELPSFEERGKIFSRQEVRVIETGPSGLLFTGDGLGDLKVWKFN